MSTVSSKNNTYRSHMHIIHILKILSHIYIHIIAYVRIYKFVVVFMLLKKKIKKLKRMSCSLLQFMWWWLLLFYCFKYNVLGVWIFILYICISISFKYLLALFVCIHYKFHFNSPFFLSFSRVGKFIYYIKNIFLI